MTKKLDVLLQRIIDSSNVNFYRNFSEEELQKRYRNLNIIGAIREIWDAIPDNNRIAIYGAGNHTLKLFEIIDVTTKNIVCIVDKLKPNGFLEGIPVIKLEQLEHYAVDTVFISTLGYGEEIKQELVVYDFGCEVVDIYEKLRIKGYNGEEPFYFQKQYEVYYKLHVLRKLYDTTLDYRFLAALIGVYIDIRDFVFALKYIDMYIYNKNPDYHNFIQLKDNLEKFFEDIRFSIEQTLPGNHRVLMIISDSLRKQDINMQTTPYLQRIFMQNILFKSAYTHAPYTHMSLLSMFSGKKLMDDHLYETGKINNDYNEFFNIVSEYGFQYTGIKPEIFPKENQRTSKFNAISYLFWDYICDIYDQECKGVTCLHFLETHTPFFCGNHTVEHMIQYGVFSRQKAKDYKHEYQQYLDCVHYLDKQCEFYFKFIVSCVPILFCSDHGYIFSENQKTKVKQIWNEDIVRIPYAVITPNQFKREVDSLLSHLDTLKILYNLLCEKEDIMRGIKTRDFVQVDRDFTYSKNDLSRMSQLNQIYLGKAFKCWVSQMDKYILYYDGVEEYYRLPDEDTNLIHDGRYRERIEMYRQSINTSFPKWKGSRFEYTRMYYEIDL